MIYDIISAFVNIAFMKRLRGYSVLFASFIREKSLQLDKLCYIRSSIINIKSKSREQNKRIIEQSSEQLKLMML